MLLPSLLSQTLPPTKLAVIDALQKPLQVPDQSWGEYKTAEKAKLKDTWRNRDAVRALEEGEEDMFYGNRGAWDPFASLLDALREEMALLKDFYKSQFTLWMQNQGKDE